MSDSEVAGLVLGIDTSTDQASVALINDDDVRAELSWYSAGQHSSHLPRAIDHVLSIADETRDSIRGIAVAKGPGSFSALRVGMSMAKGMAMGLDIPIAGIGTLDIMAFQVQDWAHHICAVLNAGRGRVYFARYDPEHLYGLVAVGPQLLEAEEAARQVLNWDFVIGDGADAMGPFLAEIWVECIIFPPVKRLRRAGFLAELGRRRLLFAEPDDPRTLEPRYVQRAAAEEKRSAGNLEDV